MAETRTVVVTGGGTGIGLATTHVLLERGWQVTAAGLERENGFPPAARFVECDVTDAASLARVFEGFETLGGLVTCAGTIQYGKEWDAAVFEKVMAVNVTGVLSSCTAARDALQRGGGSVVNIASMWSWFGNPVAPAYGTSKGAVAALTRSLAVAWGASGIRVNAVAPGWVETRISEGHGRMRSVAPGLMRVFPWDAGLTRWRSPGWWRSFCRRTPPMSTALSYPSTAAIWPPDRRLTQFGRCRRLCLRERRPRSTCPRW